MKSPQPATWSAPTNHGQDPSSPGFPGIWSFYLYLYFVFLFLFGLCIFIILYFVFVFYLVFLFLSGLHVFAVFLFILGVCIIIGFLYFTFCSPGIQVFAKPASIGWVAVSSLVGCRHRPASVDLSISHFVSSPCICCFLFQIHSLPPLSLEKICVRQMSVFFLSVCPRQTGQQASINYRMVQVARMPKEYLAVKEAKTHTDWSKSKERQFFMGKYRI